MLVVLGEPKAIQSYIKTLDTVDSTDEDLIFTLPPIDMHYSKYRLLINTIKAYKPEVIVTQSLEFLDVLLNSDLEFNVVRTKIYNRELKTAITSKDYIRKNREVWGFDPR